MGDLERRINKLESASGEEWGLTRLLDWIGAKRNRQLTADAEEPKGGLVECLERLPIATLSPLTETAWHLDRLEAVAARRHLPPPIDGP